MYQGREVQTDVGNMIKGCCLAFMIAAIAIPVLMIVGLFALTVLGAAAGGTH